MSLKRYDKFLEGDFRTSDDYIEKVDCMYRAMVVATSICLLGPFVGCAPEEKRYPGKSPLPVTVMQLMETTPSNGRLYVGSVRSWKIEDIAFEVDGRVEWVVEPGTPIEGRTYKADGDLLSPGTQIAQLDDERFLTALESAKSEVKIETLRRDGIQLQVDESLPAEIASAKSQHDLATTEYQRNQRLVAQNAGARKNLNKAKAALDETQAALDGLSAKLLLTKADVKSAEAGIEQAIQAQKDAQRNLDDTKLYSAFRGKIAAIHVVPGSLASQQAKVATIQMMNPIKVELEVSAETSRHVQLGETVTLTLSTAADQPQTAEASVYAISPSADNATRTFTLTLLVVNRKMESEIPEGIDAASAASTSGLWRVGLGILPPTDDGTYYMPEDGLHSDNRGDYVWRVTNFAATEPTQRVLSVEKLYVKPGDVSVPFLGKVRFRTVSIRPDQNFKPDADLFASDLFVGGEQTSEWTGVTMLFEHGSRWLLRPGDVVQVDLAGKDAVPGLFVPIEAIQESSGRTSVFVIESTGDGSTVKEVEVRVPNDQGSQATSARRIEPTTESINLEGQNIVVEGVHYLIDGQTVVVTGKN